MLIVAAFGLGLAATIALALGANWQLMAGAVFLVYVAAANLRRS